jgi:alkanesulfonate monooxygenase
MTAAPRVEVFSTCPPSSGRPRDRYAQSVVDIARWSEQAGCAGILVYSDNSLLDPWMLAHLILQNTAALAPLVAVQPVYMHPYWVAKQVASFGHLYDRRLYLNMVAGGFKNDLEALGDATPHDKRYARLVEYTAIVMDLLKGGPVSYDGEFHTVSKLKLTPPLPPSLTPGVFVSGSSEAGAAAARALGATAIKYPKPSRDETPAADLAAVGIRVGIIARERERDAWTIARTRFPDDRKGQITHQLAMKVSDSAWHRQLSDMNAEEGPYWLVPFTNYQTMCPYLVGSYEQVATELGRYIAVGYRTFILDVPFDREELEHIGATFARAEGAVKA